MGLLNHKDPKKGRKILLPLALLAIPMILLLLLSQSAFAKNTYVINDGDRVLVYTSAATDPAAVLDELGLMLDEDDTFTTQSALGISEITVRRAKSVTVHFSGETLEMNTTALTVGELLPLLEVGDSHSVEASVPLDTGLAEGMEITLRSVLTCVETYTSELPCNTVYCDDASLPEGEQQVVTQGRVGQQVNTVSVRYVDGVEVERTLVSQEILLQPVDTLIAVGIARPGPDTRDEELPIDSVIIGNGTITLPDGQVLTYTDTWQVRATAYSHLDEGCDMYTATGTTVRIGTVAVDPRYIPYGTRMFIVSNDGEYVYGIATAEDCGGAIKRDRIDLYYPTLSECFAFGRRDCTIYFLG